MLRSSASFTALLDDTGVKAADAAAVAQGVPLSELVARAGRAVAEVAGRDLPDGARIAVLLGPGLNGSDARAAASLLRERHQVTTFALGMVDDAELERPLGDFDSEPYDLVVDGLFGTGLRRPLDELCVEALKRLEAGGSPVLSIDLPSGIDARTGAVLGGAVRADRR